MFVCSFSLMGTSVWGFDECMQILDSKLPKAENQNDSQDNLPRQDGYGTLRHGAPQFRVRRVAPLRETPCFHVHSDPALVGEWLDPNLRANARDSPPGKPLHRGPARAERQRNKITQPDEGIVGCQFCLSKSRDVQPFASCAVQRCKERLPLRLSAKPPVDVSVNLAALCRDAAERGLRLRTLADFSAARPREGFVLGFGAIGTARLGEGIRQLGTLLATASRSNRPAR
jgi:hypothetical protein